MPGSVWYRTCIFVIPLPSRGSNDGPHAGRLRGAVVADGAYRRARSTVRAERRIEAVLLNGHGHKRRRRGAGARGSRTGCGVDVAGTLARQGCRRRALKPRKTSSPTCEVGKLEPRPGGRTARARYEHGRRPGGARRTRAAALPSADAARCFPHRAQSAPLPRRSSALLRRRTLPKSERSTSSRSRSRPPRSRWELHGPRRGRGVRGRASLRRLAWDPQPQRSPSEMPAIFMRCRASPILRSRPSSTGIERRTVLPSRPSDVMAAADRARPTSCGDVHDAVVATNLGRLDVDRQAGLPQLVGICALPRMRFPCSERFEVLSAARRCRHTTS